MAGLPLNKLAAEVRRFHNKDFLEAAMAVCALTAVSDDEVVLAEHQRVDEILANDPALTIFDAKKAVDLLYDDIYELRSHGEPARQLLYDKVRRLAGDHKRALTLMRVAYLIIDADGKIREAEKQEFARLCRLLALEPEQVWQEVSD
jgi:tellurite resistance protein TerB